MNSTLIKFTSYSNNLLNQQQKDILSTFFIFIIPLFYKSDRLLTKTQPLISLLII